MQTFCWMGAACTALGLVFACPKPTIAAETCPIYDISTGQMEPTPTLTAWSLGSEVTGTISAEDADGLVNVRESAGTEFEIVATVQPSEAIIMTDHALSTNCENWFKVTFADDRTGWVHGRYVKSDYYFSPF